MKNGAFFATREALATNQPNHPQKPTLRQPLHSHRVEFSHPISFIWAADNASGCCFCHNALSASSSITGTSNNMANKDGQGFAALPSSILPERFDHTERISSAMHGMQFCRTSPCGETLVNNDMDCKRNTLQQVSAFSGPAAEIRRRSGNSTITTRNICSTRRPRCEVRTR